jgi:hypothetical protein
MKRRFTEIIESCDITLADYWGARGTDVFDEKGVSLIHVNTDKRLNLINNLQKEISVYELPIKEAQYVFKKHDDKNGYDIKKRNLFFQVYESEGINVVMKKYCKIDNKTKYKNLIKRVISNILYSRKVFNNPSNNFNRLERKHQNVQKQNTINYWWHRQLRPRGPRPIS